MEIWADTVDLEELAEMTSNVHGLTTNPLLIKKSPKTHDLNRGQLESHFIRIFQLMKGKPVFLQTVALDKESIIHEGEALLEFAKGNGCSLPGLKIPATSEGIEAIKYFVDKGELVLGTACFKPEQIYHVGKVGANYAAIYTARATKHFQDTEEGVDGVDLIRAGMKLIETHGFPTQIMAANFRTGEDEINDVLAYGPGAVTLPYPVYNSSREPRTPNRSNLGELSLNLTAPLGEQLKHYQTRKAMQDFTDAVEECPAYLQLVYHTIKRKELGELEVRRIIDRNQKIIKEKL